MSDICRCLRALPEAQANEVALQLAGSPQLASGSSQALLLSFLRERETRLSAGQRSSFGAITLSLHVPQPWRERLSHLLGKCLPGRLTYAQGTSYHLVRCIIAHQRAC